MPKASPRKAGSLLKKMSPTKRLRSTMESFASASSDTRNYIEHILSPGSPSLKRTIHAYNTSSGANYISRTSGTNLKGRPAEEGEKGSKPNGAQTMMGHMQAHLEHLARIGELKMAWETHPLLNAQCSCNESSRTILCHDCTGREPLCPSCFLHAHRFTPFHFAIQFEGLIRRKVPMSILGLVKDIGHAGELCPSAGSEAPILMLDVVDSNGVHACNVRYCQCAGAPEHWEQLFQIGLFPASLSKPATAFTFQLLSSFDLLSSLSKCSALDFVTTLRRLTNDAFPDEVPNFYHAFRRAMRIWRAIQLKARAGEFHGLAALVSKETGLDPFFPLALRCPACPQPGLNMHPVTSMEDAERAKHKYTLFLSVDGNFKQQLKMKNGDPNDLELYEAFFVNRGDFTAYMKKTKGDIEKSTCANLKANNLQSRLKFRSMQVSGVVSCKCARHDMFMPGSTVDLEKGESFAYTDYALRNALHNYKEYPFVDLSYDIACQYSKKIDQRFSLHFPDYLASINRMAFHVPKLHCHGHSDDCKYLYSFDYSENVGRTHGERIESGWAEGNLAGPSTREMNPGHRHEVLSSFYNEWNYQQTQRLAAFLEKKLLDAISQKKSKEAHFNDLSRSLGRDRVIAWLAMDTNPVIANGRVSSVYRAKDVRSPTLGQIQDRLRPMKGNDRTGDAHLTPSDFIAEGIRLETRQRELNFKAKGDDASLQRVITEINTERLKLRAEIDIWRDDQVMYMTDVLLYVKESLLVENEELFLPSKIPKELRSQPWFQRLSGFELELRKGQADDALSDLRLCLKYRDYLNRERRNISYGNQQATRTAVILRRASGFVDITASEYRSARKAMLSLGLSPESSTYQELKPADIFIKVVYTNKQLGSGSCTGSWIWTAGKREALSSAEEAEWEEEGNRVEWFRARIDLQQWSEEVDILDEEFKRTAEWFKMYSFLWKTLAGQLTKPGFPEYAFHESYIYSKRAEDTVLRHNRARASYVN